LKSQQSIEASLIEIEEQVDQIARQSKYIAEQRLNSLQDSNLNFDSGYTCDFDTSISITDIFVYPKFPFQW